MRARLAASVLAGVVLAGVAVACDDVAPPRDQWTIVIGTDAAVPQFGDRLLVEIVDEDGDVCSSCRRQFGAADASSWPLSFGVAPREDGKRLGVRARLYRADVTGQDGLPGNDRHIDAFAWLPEPLGIASVGLELRMSCFGVPAAIGESCDPRTGARGPAPELAVSEGAPPVAMPGSWEGIAVVPCASTDVREGEVCVEGGVFLLGSPHYLPLDASLIPVPEQLVGISTLLVDQEELTVGELKDVLGGVVPPSLRGDPLCTFDRGDDLPVNCVTWQTADAACKALGKRLPTAAEWEFVASNRTRETDFPWLDAAGATCEVTVVDQDRGRCRPSGEPIGPIAGGAAGDVTLVGVRNLAGNVSEWVDGAPVAYASTECWGHAIRLIVDPVCRSSDPDVAGQNEIRGASWAADFHQLRSTSRNAGSGASVETGFRCVRRAAQR